MPRFYFDLASPAGMERDEFGLLFEGIEAAYLDACRAALEISLDMLKARQDPRHHHFEIKDSAGCLLMDIPFVETVRPSLKASRPVMTNPTLVRINENVKRARVLKDELAREIVRAQQTIESVRTTLGPLHARP